MTKKELRRLKLAFDEADAKYAKIAATYITASTKRYRALEEHKNAVYLYYKEHGV